MIAAVLPFASVTKRNVLRLQHVARTGERSPYLIAGLFSVRVGMNIEHIRLHEQQAQLLPPLAATICRGHQLSQQH